MKTTEEIIQKNAKFFMKEKGISMEAALEMARSVAAEFENSAPQLRVAGWFIQKNFNQNERMVITSADSAAVVKETEKAVRVKWVSDYGTVFGWVPKSCLV